MYISVQRRIRTNGLRRAGGVRYDLGEVWIQCYRDSICGQNAASTPNLPSVVALIFSCEIESTSKRSHVTFMLAIQRQPQREIPFISFQINEPGKGQPQGFQQVVELILFNNVRPRPHQLNSSCKVLLKTLVNWWGCLISEN